MTSMRFCVSVLLLCALAGPAVPQAAVPGSVLAANGITRYRDGFLLVGFVNGLSASQQNAAVANVSLGTMKHLGFGVYLVNVGSGRVLGAIQSLKARGEIRFAEPDFLNELSGSPTPTDPLFGQQWGLNNAGQVLTDPNASQGAGTPGADMKAKLAWSMTTGSPSVVIAVLDTGVQYTHPDLVPNIWNNPGGIALNGLTQSCPAGTHGYNAVAAFPSGSIVYPDPCDPMDDDPLPPNSFGGHGTKVTGAIAAATNSGQGTAGLAWSTTILPIKWTSGDGTGWNSTLVGAINWVIQLQQAGVNIKIINDSASWRSTGGVDAGAYSQAVMDAINAAGNNGILFVTPAGNNALDVTPGGTGEVRYPCDYHTSNMICVAATTNMDTLWSSSNYSQTMVDLAAPAVDIVSPNRLSGYDLFSGTSVAAPFVSGTAALILSTGDMTVSALKASILNNVDVLSSLAGKTATSGRLNVCKAIPGCSTATVGTLTNVAPPVVTGLTVFGSVLGASTGRWTGLPDSYSYQWQRCGTSCADIPGATMSVYPVLAAADVNSKLAVKITVTNSAGTVSATSAQIGPITSATSPFALTSTVQDGQNISATPSWQITPSQAVNFVQFYIDGVLAQTISGAGPYSFTPAALSSGSHVLGVRALSTDNRTYAFYGATVSVGSPVLAAMISPLGGSTLPGASVTFSWTAGTGVSTTYLWIGTTVGGRDLANFGGGTATSFTASNIPTTGIPIYVRLWSRINGGLQYADYVYTAANIVLTAMVSPLGGSILPGASVTFSWTAGTGVSTTYLWIGTTVGGRDLANFGGGTATSFTASNIPTTGIPIYVRLWSRINGGLQYIDYVYTATALGQ